MQNKSQIRKQQQQTDVNSVILKVHFETSNVLPMPFRDPRGNYFCLERGNESINRGSSNRDGVEFTMQCHASYPC